MGSFQKENNKKFHPLKIFIFKTNKKSKVLLGRVYGSRQIEFSRRQRLGVGGGVKESN